MTKIFPKLIIFPTLQTMKAQQKLGKINKTNKQIISYSNFRKKKTQKIMNEIEKFPI